MDLTYAAAEEMLSLLAAKRVSARELLDMAVKRCDAVHAKINAVVIRDVERAKAEALAIDDARANGEPLGPLAGLPMTVKEAFDIAGMPACVGNPDYRERPSDVDDAEMVERVRGADAIIWGKTNVPYMLMDLQCYNSIYGTTNNPYDLTRTPGGSSGGSSAALAAGITSLEIGSDIGGSLRHPANFSGVFALKPTWEKLSQRGHVPPLPEHAFGPTDLAVVGPMARTARDLRLLFHVLSGRKPKTRPLQSIKGKRIAMWIDQREFPASTEVKAAVVKTGEALQRAGAIVAPAKPDINIEEMTTAYGATLRSIVVPGVDLDPRYTRQREQQKAAVARFFDNWDALLMPVTPTVALPHDHTEPAGARMLDVDGQQVAYYKFLGWITLATTCHLPAAVAPAAWTREALPIGVQIVGPEDGDDSVIDLAEHIERELGGFKPPQL